MNEVLVLTLIVVASIFVVISGIIGIYNKLVQAKNAVKNAWAQIDTQLKRRYDLIPNLIESVKGYMEHEKNTLEMIIKARNSAMTITNDAKAKSKAEGELSNTLKNLFACFSPFLKRILLFCSSSDTSRKIFKSYSIQNFG